MEHRTQSVAISSQPARSAARWLFIIVSISVPFVATVMWLRRRAFLRSVDCTTLGPYDCGYDGGLAAAYGFLVGTVFVTLASAGWLVARRWPRLGVVVAVIAVAGWVMTALVLIAATQR